MGSIIFYRSALIEFVIISEKRLCFDEHCHVSNIVLTAVLDGTAELCLNGVTAAACKDDVFCISPVHFFGPSTFCVLFAKIIEEKFGSLRYFLYLCNMKISGKRWPDVVCRNRFLILQKTQQKYGKK